MRKFNTSEVCGEKMKTLNGFMIHLKGFFFFVDETMEERIPWKITIKKGILPHKDEWNRLQKDHGLQPEPITDLAEFKKLIQIRQDMEKHPESWMTMEEFVAYEKFQKHRLKKNLQPFTAYQSVPLVNKTVMGSALEKASKK